MTLSRRTRRLLTVVISLTGCLVWLFFSPDSYETIFHRVDTPTSGSPAEATLNPAATNQPLAVDILSRLEVKGRAAKTGYTREQFYAGWPIVDGCNLRQKILKREFGDSAVLDGCTVLSGEFDEPYTGEHRIYNHKTDIAKGLQIDHVVALSDAWQKGAQYKSREVRYQIATDPLNLLAVDGPANEQKSDGDAATWLPPNKKFRCAYVARQVSVKYKYGLWVTEAEKSAISRILLNCPTEPAVGVD